MKYFLILPLLLLTACAHQAPLMTPTEMAAYERKKADRAERSARRDAEAAARQAEEDRGGVTPEGAIPGERRSGDPL